MLQISKLPKRKELWDILSQWGDIFEKFSPKREGLWETFSQNQGNLRDSLQVRIFLDIIYPKEIFLDILYENDTTWDLSHF